MFIMIHTYHLRSCSFVCTALCMLSGAASAAEPIEADYVIAGGTLYDGSGGDGIAADVAVKGDKIVAVGKFETKGSPRAIDAKELIVAPGFIDLHSHSDEPIQRAKTRQNANFLMQGV